MTLMQLLITGLKAPFTFLGQMIEDPMWEGFKKPKPPKLLNILRRGVKTPPANTRVAHETITPASTYSGAIKRAQDRSPKGPGPGPSELYTRGIRSREPSIEIPTRDRRRTRRSPNDDPTSR